MLKGSCDALDNEFLRIPAMPVCAGTPYTPFTQSKAASVPFAQPIAGIATNPFMVGTDALPALSVVCELEFQKCSTRSQSVTLI